MYVCPAPVRLIRQHKENDLKWRGDAIADQRYPLDEFYKQRPEAGQLKYLQEDPETESSALE